MSDLGIKMLAAGNKHFWAQWTVLALRLVIGYGFMAHGWAKLSRGPDKFAHVLNWMGVPFPDFMAWLVTSLEIIGGLAILIGAFVALISIPLIAIHLVAMLGVHLKYGFSSVNTIGLTMNGPQFGPPGYEVNLLYIAGLLTIALGGAGVWSLDYLRTKSKSVHRPPSKL
ncbi:MAG TPA: DoxX family protein [Methylophilaceae bacterium]|nr:DoxX family protein [Methylophilaceae bacterium]